MQADKSPLDQINIASFLNYKIVSALPKLIKLV